MIARYIQIYDDVFEDVVFDKGKEIASEIEFKSETHGQESFVIGHSNILNVMLGHVLKTLYNSPIRLHLGFCRLSTQSIDTTRRIHSDGMMAGKYSAVYYIDINDHYTGTRFYRHDKHGYAMPNDLSTTEINRLLIEDSDKHSMWNKHATVYARPNRLLVYQSDLFHRKFPSKCNAKRIVWVGFYDINNKRKE